MQGWHSFVPSTAAVVEVSTNFKRTPVKQTGVNTANLLNIQLNTNVRPAKLCLLNARSVCGRANFLVDYVADHDLDIMCISQLWPALYFECLYLQLCCHRVSSTLRLFVIYRPPSSSPNSQTFAIFLTEFRDLVERVGTKSGIIIFGDFNVRYGGNSDAHTRALHDILSDASMRQNVTNAMRNRSNVLDLVISASSPSL